MELDPGAVAAHTVLRWAYEKKGMMAEAMAAFEQERVFAGESPTTSLKRAHVLALSGKHDEARAILRERLDKRSEDWVSAYEVAIVFSDLDEFDNAFEWLRKAEEEHAVGFTFVRVDPRLEKLWSDPRFTELVENIHKTES
jgi:tetratricopeptide (TPR) repeat protein